MVVVFADLARCLLVSLDERRCWCGVEAKLQGSCDVDLPISGNHVLRPERDLDWDCHTGPGPHAISQVTTGSRVASIGGQRNLREGPEIEGGDGLCEVIQKCHSPKVGCRLHRRVYNVDAEPRDAPDLQMPQSVSMLL